ncbi:transposase [Streptomyces chartreusis]|uniref:transposase n=1 Tax=Streptomyces chartreusis TaxID=1969 RepID=UPI003D8D21B1
MRPGELHHRLRPTRGNLPQRAGERQLAGPAGGRAAQGHSPVRARRCGRCPEQAKCTPGPFRSLHFPTRRLHELQTKNRADKQDTDWRRLYRRRSGAEGTIEEFADSHRGRRCRYRGLAKTHVQHVLTALAINVERLSLQEPADGSYRPRPPTALQQCLVARDLPRLLWWRQGK